MVQVYTQRKYFKPNEKYLDTYRAIYMFYREAYDGLDFSKYAEVFYDIEQGMCKRPEDLKIDFDYKKITNSVGTCSFTCLGTGMKLLMTFLYLCEKYEKHPEIKTRNIVDCTNAGNNVIRYFIKYSDKFNLPFYCRNYTFSLPPMDYRFSFNGQGNYSSLELQGEYYADVFKKNRRYTDDGEEIIE